LIGLNINQHTREPSFDSPKRWWRNVSVKNYLKLCTQKSLRTHGPNGSLREEIWKTLIQARIKTRNKVVPTHYFCKDCGHHAKVCLKLQNQNSNQEAENILVKEASAGWENWENAKANAL